MTTGLKTDLGSAPRTTLDARTSGPVAPPANRWRLLLIVGGGLVALTLLIIAFNLDRSASKPERQSRLTDEINVAEIAPGRLTEDDIDQRSGDLRSQADLALRQGGWIYITDRESGKVVQKYSADRLLPRGPNVVEMESPRAQLFFDDGRILTLHANEAIANQRDDDMLESGRASGDVVIRLFEGTPELRADVDHDAPAVLVLAEEAEFDNIRGEISSDREVNVQTESLDFHGVGFRAIYDEQHGLQRLTVERATRPARIPASALQQQEAESTEKVGDAPEPADAPEDRARRDADVPQRERARETAPRERRERQPREADERPARQDDAPALVEPPTDDPAPPVAVEPDQDVQARDRAERARNREERARRRREATEVQRPTFYEATFHENVRIWNGDAATPEQLVTADTMRIIFSMDNGGIGSSLASAFQPEPARIGVAIEFMPHIRSAIAAAVLASLAQEMSASTPSIVPAPAPDDLYLMFDGQLVVTPIEASQSPLASNDDVFLELLGAPVTLTDRAKDASATCGRIVYLASDETLTMLGTTEAPLRMENPELVASGERFDYIGRSNRGLFIGPGEMHLRRHPAAADAEDDAIESPETATGGELDIAWVGGVELLFTKEDAATGHSGLRTALFSDQVVVTEERFRLASNDLLVGFADPPAGDEAIERIEADGGVQIVGLGEHSGLLETERLVVEFEPDPATGEMQPRTMVATGGALVEDPTQRVSGQSIIVTLVKAEPDADDDDAAKQAGRFDDMQIETFEVVENVEVTLDNGTYASGDRLLANAMEEWADLTGRRVIVKGSQEDSDFEAEGTHARVTREGTETQIVMDGTGHAKIFDYPPAQEGLALPPPPDAERVPLQVIDVDWSDELRYVEHEGDVRGFIDILGNVRAVSKAAAEENSIECLKMSMILEEVPSNGGATADAEEREGKGRSRSLRHVTARGNVKAASRVWSSPERTGPPRLIYIEGDHVDYDQKDQTSEVVGPGQLLISDHSTPAEGASRNDLTGRGNTLFAWKQGMSMRQLFEGRYEITMRDDVRMQHDSLAGDENDSTITCGELVVTVSRTEPATDDEQAENVVEAAPQPDKRVAGLDFGGSSEIHRLEARGGVVFLKAMGKEIECRELIYNRDAQIAQILGWPNRDAMVRTRESVAPLRAKEFTWDLSTDTIRITGASGRGAGG